MRTYFSKAEDETSETIKQATKEAVVAGALNFEKMKAITRVK